MKKSITRIGALLLVLALLVSAAPFALADETIQITGPTSVKVGESIELSANYSGEAKVSWSLSGSAASGEEKDGKYIVTGNTAGDAVVTASASDESGTVVATGQQKITVEPAAVIPGQLTISGGNKVALGETLPLTASDAAGTPVADATWTSTNEAVATVAGGVVTPVSVGKTTIKAATADAEGSVEIEVTKKTVTASITGAPSSMKVGDTAQLSLVLDVAEVKAASVQWTSSDPSVEVDSATGKITAKAGGTGKATITAAVTLSQEDLAKYSLANDGKAVAEITVGTVVLSVNLANNVERLKSVTLTPSVSGLPENAVVNYTFTPVYGSSLYSGSVNVASVSASNDQYKGAVSVQGTSVGVAEITVSAAVSGNNDIKIDPVTVYIGVYDSHTVKASADTWKIKFSDTGVLKTLYKDNGSNVAKQRSLINALGANNGDYIKVTVTDGKNVGTFSSNDWVAVDNCALTFTAIRNGTVKATYTVAAYRDKTYYVVSEGTLELTIGDAEGDIEYELGSNGKVTFDEKDFVTFWNNNKTANKYTGSLSYVKFDITTSVPYYGILYTTSSATKKVTTSHKAYYNYSATNNNYYCDLDQVTYVVDTKNYRGLTDTVPFTAYNEKGDGISGIIVIHLGDGEATSITSRGVAFGTGGITKIIEANYKAATGKDLDYLTFSSVSASSGKLFYNFSNVLNSTPVTTKYEFYVDPTGTQMDLDKVAFVPRAGLYGEVSIKYTGYDVNGKNSYEGKITFKVTQKTKSAVFSDVTASSYSWAADSVDFLYYEEVANGSNGKYNPKSNITRGDFMLMLYRAFLEEDYGNYNVTTNFPDVVKGTTSYSKETYQAVGVAKYLGIAQGSNGKYNPTSYITREEAMTLIYRTLDEVGYSMSYTVSTSTSSFSDYSSVSSYAKAAIKDLIGHGVVIGTNGKIQPKSNITRAEMAVILHRVLTY